VVFGQLVDLRLTFWGLPAGELFPRFNIHEGVACDSVKGR
jgi:hypothetical protein